MWYLRKVASSCKQFNPVSIYLCLEYMKFWEQNFMYLGHKHVKIGLNCSRELATFLKYHMPLKDA